MIFIYHLEDHDAYTPLTIPLFDLSLIPLDSDVAEEAARLRARYGLMTPDAIQLASAIKGGARGYVTNDHTHRRVAELEVLVLDDMLGLT
jgi:predicted nucleic acid-binding protein